MSEARALVAEEAPFPPPRLLRRQRLLVVPLGGPHAVLSWAPLRGGRCRAEAIVWRQVTDAELGPGVDPALLLSRSLAGVGLPGAVGLLTARDLAAFDEVALSDGRLRVRCVATVGLGNALSAGDPPGAGARVGTINLLVQASQPLAEPALVEAVALAAEARTAAVLAAGIPSRRSGAPATGTGTDCIAAAAPERGGSAEAYAGKHTQLGALIGAAVREATARGVRRWLDERRPRWAR